MSNPYIGETTQRSIDARQDAVSAGRWADTFSQLRDLVGSTVSLLGHIGQMRTANAVSDINTGMGIAMADYERENVLVDRNGRGLAPEEVSANFDQWFDDKLEEVLAGVDNDAAKEWARNYYGVYKARQMLIIEREASVQYVASSVATLNARNSEWIRQGRMDLVEQSVGVALAGGIIDQRAATSTLELAGKTIAFNKLMNSTRNATRSGLESGLAFVNGLTDEDLKYTVNGEERHLDEADIQQLRETVKDEFNLNESQREVQNRRVATDLLNELQKIDTEYGYVEWADTDHPDEDAFAMLLRRAGEVDPGNDNQAVQSMVQVYTDRWRSGIDAIEAAKKRLANGSFVPDQAMVDWFWDLYWTGGQGAGDMKAKLWAQIDDWRTQPAYQGHAQEYSELWISWGQKIDQRNFDNPAFGLMYDRWNKIQTNTEYSPEAVRRWSDEFFDLTRRGDLDAMQEFIDGIENRQIEMDLVNDLAQGPLSWLYQREENDRKKVSTEERLLIYAEKGFPGMDRTVLGNMVNAIANIATLSFDPRDPRSATDLINMMAGGHTGQLSPEQYHDASVAANMVIAAGAMYEEVRDLYVGDAGDIAIGVDQRTKLPQMRYEMTTDGQGNRLISQVYKQIGDLSFKFVEEDGQLVRTPDTAEDYWYEEVYWVDSSGRRLQDSQLNDTMRKLVHPPSQLENGIRDSAIGRARGAVEASTEAEQDRADVVTKERAPALPSRFVLETVSAAQAVELAKPAAAAIQSFYTDKESQFQRMDDGRGLLGRIVDGPLGNQREVRAELDPIYANLTSSDPAKVAAGLQQMYVIARVMENPGFTGPGTNRNTKALADFLSRYLNESDYGKILALGDDAAAITNWLARQPRR